MADYFEDLSVYYDRRTGTYYCRDCRRSFSDKTAIENHLLNAAIHADDCLRCRQSFEDETALIAHCQTSPRHYLCEGLHKGECGFDGHSFQELCDHRDENGCYRYCTKCSTRKAGWFTANELRSHLLKEHSYVCNDCNFKLLTASGLREVRLDGLVSRARY